VAQVPTNANPMVIPYNSGNDIFYETGFTNLFTNLETTGCPVTSCTLFDSVCGTAYSGTITNFYQVTPLATSPWALKAKTNTVDGWSAITFCYQCEVTASDGVNKFTKDIMTGWSVR
jgi:hypothetical protein